MADIDIFNPRRMLKAVRQIKPSQRYMLQTYFKGSEQFTTKSVDVDIVKGKRRMAKFDNKNAEGTIVNRNGFKTINFEPPYMKPKTPTTAEDALSRQPGDDLYEEGDPLTNAARIMGEDFAELKRMIERRMEWMAFRAVQDGEITVIGNGVSRTIEFDFEANHLVVLTGSDAWDDDEADPIEDIKDWRDRVLADFGVAPSEVIMGKDAAKAFVAHPKVQEAFNKYHILPGSIKPEPSENFINYGYIAVIGMTMKEVSEKFIDPEDDSTEREMVDANAVILLTPTMEAPVLFGAIHHMKALRAVPFWPHSWEVEDPSARWVQLHSSPLPTIKTPDAVLCARVLE